MSHYSTHKLADQLYGSFEVIYRAWQETKPQDTHLWELTQGKSALRILEQDLVDIGHYFSAADAIGERAEVYLIAEYIAELRAAHGNHSVPRKAEDLVAEIGAWLLERPELVSLQRENIYAPVCFRIGQLSVAKGVAHKDTFAVLRQTLSDIGYHFLLRDGNVTIEEDTRIKEFHDTLS